MIFKEVEFLERPKKVKESGFEYFEFWTWQNKNRKALQTVVKDLKLKIASFSGDENFSMINGEEKEAYIDLLAKSIITAKDLNCRNLVIHSDALLKNGQAKTLGRNLSTEEKFENMYNILKKAAPIAEKEKVRLVLEPLNSLVDHKNYFLDNPETAFLLVKMVDSEYVKVLYDIYHMQIMVGNIIKTIRENIDYIGYIHIADVPGRYEPGTGELNFYNILQELARIKYNGIIGFELEPRVNSELAIKKIKEVLI